jgi:hypothetical protein
MMHTTGHSRRDRLAAICDGGALVGAHRAVEGLEPLRAAHDLGAQQPQALGRVPDGLVVDAGHEPVADALERVQVAGAFELMYPHLGERVQRHRAGQRAHRGGLALAGDRADQPVVVHQRHLDDPAAHIGAERHRGEHVGLAAAQQRPGALLGLGHVLPPDPQLEAPGVLGGDGFGPHGAERPAEAGGELLAAFGDHRRGHPIRQVNLGPPSGAVLTHRGREHQLAAVAEPPVDPGDTQRPERAGDHVLGRRLHRRRQRRGGHDRLMRRAARTGEQGQHDGASQHPRPRRGEGEGDHRRNYHQGTRGEDEPAGGAGFLPGLVDPQMVGQEPVRGGLPLELGQVRHMPPGEQQARGAHDPHQRPPGGERHVHGCPDAVVGGGVGMADSGQAHMLAGCCPAAPVPGDDRLALLPAVAQVGVCRAGGLGGAHLGARVGGAQRDNLAVPAAVDRFG